MIVMLAAVAFAASAQKKYYITPHVGVGYAHMFNMPYGLNDGLTVMGGGEFEYMLGEKLGLSGGLDVQFIRTDEVQEIAPVQSDWRHFSFIYFNVPILAQYHFGRFAVKAGLQPSFNLFSKYYEGSNSNSVRDAMHTVSLSLPVGVSYQFKKVPVVLDMRCSVPLTKQNNGSWGNDGNTRTLSVMLSAGYRF